MIHTAKGIKGIRHFLAVRAYETGWHAFLGEEWQAYYKLNVYEINEILTKECGPVTFVGWIGNVLSFETGTE